MGDQICLLDTEINFPTDVESMRCVACLYFALRADPNQKLCKIHKMTGELLGQEKSAQNTATAKTHFYMFKYITEGCQITFVRTKATVQNPWQKPKAALVFLNYLVLSHLCYL